MPVYVRDLPTMYLQCNFPLPSVCLPIPYVTATASCASVAQIRMNVVCVNLDGGEGTVSPPAICELSSGSSMHFAWHLPGAHQEDTTGSFLPGGTLQTFETPLPLPAPHTRLLHSAGWKRQAARLCCLLGGWADMW